MQAPADCNIFMKIPPGFTVENNTLLLSSSHPSGTKPTHALKIKKNMYGLKQAGNNCFDALKTSIIRLGFHQSAQDPCLFIKHNCIILTYVDDCLLFARTDVILDDILISLKKKFYPHFARFSWSLPRNRHPPQ
jgi:hypothetical protein